MRTGPARTVIITGASSGIGRCTAALFAREGWDVGLIARGAAGLAETAKDVEHAGQRSAVAIADVTDAAALGDAAAAIVACLGPPQLWINCAGNGVYGRFTQTPADEFDRVTAVTYGGTVNGCRIALGLMTPYGTGGIINVCSATAFHGLPLMTSYSGAKAAVRGFSQALQAELSIERSRIRVSTVFPPAVNTPFFAHAPSHMGRPARPAPPVYQPEVVARGILLAARTGRAEVVVSGTAAIFNIAVRISPKLIAHAMTRLGFDGQLTRDPSAAQLQNPTLWAAAAEPSSVHGAFSHIARRRSIHLSISQAWHGLLLRLSSATAGLARRAAQLRPIRLAPMRGPAHEDWVERDGAA